MFEFMIPFSLGLLNGCVFYMILRAKKKTSDEYYFMTPRFNMCQLCHAQKVSFKCQEKKCSYDILLKIISLIDQAEKSLEIAFCVVSSSSVLSAILEARQRGVEVRVIVCKSLNTPDCVYELSGNGVAVKRLGFDQFLMHNKFMVVDERVLVRGSLNLNKSGFTDSFQNLQMLYSLDKIAWYSKLFKRMWNDVDPIHKNSLEIS